MGTDIVAVARIADLMVRHDGRFLARCFLPAEIAYIESRGRGSALSAAARWCAKEAFLKALGRDVTAIPYRDIEVVRSAEGPVTLRLYGRAAQALAEGGAHRCHLALTHEKEYAAATVILEKAE